MKLPSIVFASSFCLLTACSSTENNTAPPPLALVQSNTFTQTSVETQQEIFALSKHVKQQLDSTFPKDGRSLQSTKGLLRFLLQNGDASLSYQSGATLTANQAYENLNANCLSLSILAYSLADYLGLEGQFQKVHIPEYWALDNGFNLLTGHINLKVSESTKQVLNRKVIYPQERSLVIDFDPNSRQEAFKTSNINKARITAMFYNNKGAAAMLKHDYDTAFSYYKAAVDIDSNYSGAWGNLGVLFRLTSDYQSAETAYQYAISLDPDNNTALGNLARLYNLTDRKEQGQAILAMLDKKRQANPYYHISLGNDAYTTSRYQDAIKHYKKARDLNSTLHDTDFGLARTYYQLGDLKLAKKYLTMANNKADFDHDKQRYESKLQALRSHTAKLIDYR
ncbi:MULTISPECIES: tetratricopeptide repeat protein [unclassified Pseudoalteromonas]|uniref:tetratricopeptide repeat protein n=1 Tax=unclassified Pseudoalteromonas TaxID=194690 RepID=UPI0018F2A686|nr:MULTISPECIES: tetratricopeptide repeat protein [unclassified Pseudoalteromonas]MCF2915319.1 tetratricopeptide repeat protein [Pseudoalteromonas sp. Cn5-37]